MYKKLGKEAAGWGRRKQQEVHAKSVVTRPTLSNLISFIYVSLYLA